MKFHLILILALLLVTSAAYAQETAAPAAIVTPEIIPQTAPQTLQESDVQGQVVLELFSSQACAFCPKADALMGDLAALKNIIALTCHVDYYDVAKGSLSRPFCTARQSAYASSLRSGPTYTPQMVINGAHDVVGYRLDDISKIIRKASRPGAQAIAISKTDVPSRYKIELPVIELPKTALSEDVKTTIGTYDLWIAFVDKPHDVKIEDGGNKGLDVKYVGIISDLFPLGKWDGSAKTMQVDLKTLSRNESFVVLAQKPGADIVAAGKQNLDSDEKSKDKEEETSLLDFDFFNFFDN